MYLDWCPASSLGRWDTQNTSLRVSLQAKINMVSAGHAPSLGPPLGLANPMQERHNTAPCICFGVRWCMPWTSLTHSGKATGSGADTAIVGPTFSQSYEQEGISSFNSLFPIFQHACSSQVSSLPEHPQSYAGHSIHARRWQKIAVTQKISDRERRYCPEPGSVICCLRTFLGCHTIRHGAWMSHSLHACMCMCEEGTCLVAFGSTENT